jgi:hypothetical protein
MKNLKKITVILSLIILAICVYSFLIGNEVFKGKFANDAISWYILAKGIFCSVMLYFIVLIMDILRNK